MALQIYRFSLYFVVRVYEFAFVVFPSRKHDDIVASLRVRLSLSDKVVLRVIAVLPVYAGLYDVAEFILHLSHYDSDWFRPFVGRQLAPIYVIVP